MIIYFGNNFTITNGSVIRLFTTELEEAVRAFDVAAHWLKSRKFQMRQGVQLERVVSLAYGLVNHTECPPTNREPFKSFKARLKQLAPCRKNIYLFILCKDTAKLKYTFKPQKNV